MNAVPVIPDQIFYLIVLVIVAAVLLSLFTYGKKLLNQETQF